MIHCPEWETLESTSGRCQQLEQSDRCPLGQPQTELCGHLYDQATKMAVLLLSAHPCSARPCLPPDPTHLSKLPPNRRAESVNAYVLAPGAS